MSPESRRINFKILARVLILIVFLITMGCAGLGPDHAGPEASAPDAWHTRLDDGVVLGYFPARQAARLDPIEALRHE